MAWPGAPGRSRTLLHYRRTRHGGTREESPGIHRVDGTFASAFAFACSSRGPACRVSDRTVYRQAAFRAGCNVALGAELHAWAALDVFPGAEAKMAPGRRLHATLGGNSRQSQVIRHSGTDLGPG